MKYIVVDDRIIGDNYKTFIVAEIGINHGGDIELAKKLITAAIKNGADAVKFQTYITEKRVPKNDPLFPILKKCEFKKEETIEIFEFAQKKHIIFFSTPFDEESVDLLANLNVPLLKISSFDIVNKKLLEKAAKTHIPVVLSRGMANTNEIETALQIYKKYNTKYILLHCVSSYPTQHKDANLNAIKILKEKYDCPVGYSDHTLGITVPVYAVAVGACVIEKHFTLDKTLKGPDHSISADPAEFKRMVRKIRDLELILGNGNIMMSDAEKKSIIYRRKS